MTLVRIPEAPAGHLDAQAAAIRAPAAAAAFALPAQARLNWLLGWCGAGLIYSGCWEDPADTWDGACYHRPGDNPARLVVVALIEGVTGAQTGTLDFTPASGSTVTWETAMPAAGARFGDWTLWVAFPELATTGLQQHVFEMTNLEVRALSVWELPHRVLDTASHTVLPRRDGAWAGLERGRRITEDDVAGIEALLQGTRAARDETKRHFTWCVPEADAWSVTPAPAATWVNIADAALGTSGFGFPHTARLIREAETERQYDVLVKGRKVGANVGDLSVESAGTSDTVAFSALPASFPSAAWTAADSGYLDVDCTAIDFLVPSAKNDDGATAVELCGITFVET